MDVRMLPTFCHTVTILNCRKGKGSPDHLDIWQKTVLHNCVWSSQVNRSIAGVEVALGASFLVRVPASRDYRPYGQWKDDMNGFTFTTGDFLVLGEVQEEVTADNVQAIVNKYRPHAFEVKLFRDNTIGPLPHYRLEGV